MFLKILISTVLLSCHLCAVVCFQRLPTLAHPGIRQKNLNLQIRHGYQSNFRTLRHNCDTALSESAKPNKEDDGIYISKETLIDITNTVTDYINNAHKDRQIIIKALERLDGNKEVFMNKTASIILKLSIMPKEDDGIYMSKEMFTEFINIHERQLFITERLEQLVENLQCTFNKATTIIIKNKISNVLKESFNSYYRYSTNCVVQGFDQLVTLLHGGQSATDLVSTSFSSTSSSLKEARMLSRDVMRYSPLSAYMMRY